MRPLTLGHACFLGAHLALEPRPSVHLRPDPDLHRESTEPYLGVFDRLRERVSGNSNFPTLGSFADVLFHAGPSADPSILAVTGFIVSKASATLQS